MYSGYGGSPSRALSTMSLAGRPPRRVASRGITRSQSFAGVNSYDKRYRNLSVFSTQGLTRKTSRASRIFTMSGKNNCPPKTPQPQRLDEVYEALKKGLQSCLQVHQIALEGLNKQMKESKRNSRLGFLYELDKQVKIHERYMRRLEFHLSKIEELYEAYCLQRRLRDGADKMVKAFIASPGSKEARESLSEANKGYKEYTENMCVLESEIESQLGEFHIKMKGLAGFARLCAGDQYEIFMKYGRQRWKLRGRMELNAKQVWDSEDMVFLPLLTEFLSIKLTELKKLASHVVVGSVSCETKDLFAALPQTVAVDINDLGTIKLSLEVTWNPFDKDDQASAAGTVNKAPTVNKRFSLLNHSPPDTPPLREQAFYSLPWSLSGRQRLRLRNVFRDTLGHSCPCRDQCPERLPIANMLRRHDELENGTAWSNSSESSDDSSSPQMSVGGLRYSTAVKPVVVPLKVQPARTESASQIDIAFSSRDCASPVLSANEVKTEPQAKGHREGTVTTTTTTTTTTTGTRVGASLPVTTGGTVPNGHALRPYMRSLSHISEDTTDGVLLTDRSPGESRDALHPATPVLVDDIEMSVPSSIAADTPPLRVVCFEDLKEACAVRAKDKCGEVDTAEPREQEAPSVATCAQAVALPECADDDVCYVAHRVSVEAEEQPGTRVAAVPVEVKASADSCVEEALGALVSALDDYRGQFPELQVLEQELRLLQVTLKGGRLSRSPSVASLTVETALGSFDFLNTSDQDEEEGGTGRRSRDGSVQQDRGCLTTGFALLDCTLVVHLENCSSQLLRLGMFGPLRCGEMYALDRLLIETRVLGTIRRIAKETPGGLTQPDAVIPDLELCQGAASLWQQCMGQGDVYRVSAETFMVTVARMYLPKLPEKATKISNAVFLRLVEKVIERRLPRREGNGDKVMVTIFQFWSYLYAEGVTEMDTHITELAEEVWLVQSLSSPDQEVLVRALKHPPECSLRREGLHAVAKLLKDPRGKVTASASSLLRSLAEQPMRRERALVSSLELLEDEHIDTRVCGCKALACLKAKESIDQLVYLCRTDKDEVRAAAKQALLVLGEEGKMAHRHVETSQDGIPRLFSAGSMASTAF